MGIQQNSTLDVERLTDRMLIKCSIDSMQDAQKGFMFNIDADPWIWEVSGVGWGVLIY